MGRSAHSNGAGLILTSGLYQRTLHPCILHNMNLNSAPRGDVYVPLCASRDHAVARQHVTGDGFVFTRTSRKSPFADGLAPSDPVDAYELAAWTVGKKPALYYDIIPRLVVKNGTPNRIFIPVGSDKKEVADHLRTRLGQGTMLLRS